MPSQPATLKISAAGDTLHALYWEAPEKRDVFVCLHGVESHSDWFRKLAAALLANGVSCFAFDRPGCGRSAGQEASDIERYREMVNTVFTQMQSHERCHGVGLSWGGLLLAQIAMTQPELAHSWHFVAPGWFPRRRGAMMRKWTRHLGSDRFPLLIEPKDFSDNSEDQEWIAGDPLRKTSVSPQFLKLSAAMMWRLTRSWPKTQLHRANLYLAAEDAVIRNAATRKLFVRAAADTIFWRQYADTKHSLVLELPTTIARDMIAHCGVPQ